MKKTILTTMAVAFAGMTVNADETNGNTSNPAPTSPAPLQTASSSMSLNDHRFEAGAIFGEPTGASLKYWLNDKVAVDGAVGWAFRDDSDFYLHSDVLWHAFDVFPVSKGALPLYFGVGGLAKFRDNADDIYGIRFPIGVNYLFENAPVSLFLEVAPVLDVAPSTRGDITAGIGVRYRF